LDGRWPFFRPPEKYAGVRRESERSIRDLFTASEVLDEAGIERVTRTLAQALPPK
jgi:hypothetical protein